MEMVHGVYLSSFIGITSVFALYISFLLVKKASGVIQIPFVATFFMFRYVVFAYVGSVLLNMFYFTYEVHLGIYQRPDILLTIWYYGLAGLFLIPLGMFIANWATGYKPIYYTRKVTSKPIDIQKEDTSPLMFFLVLAFFLLALTVLLVYKSKIGTFPIMGVLDGLTASDLALLRSDSVANFDGKYYRYAMFMKTLPLFLLFIVFFLKNQSFAWKMLFYTILAYNMFTSVMDLQKAPIIKLFLLLMLAYFYSKNTISKKLLIGSFSVLAGLMMIMYMFFMGMADRSFFDILGAPLHRIFIGQIEPFFYYHRFVEEYGYIYGTSLPNPAHMFDFEYRKITVEVMDFAHPELAKFGLVGSMPTVFYAEWFINFGVWIAVLSMLLFGFMIQMVDIIFLTYLAKYKSLLASVLFVFLINYFSKFAGTGFTGILFDTDWMFPTFIMFFMIVLRHIIKQFLKGLSREKRHISRTQ